MANIVESSGTNTSTFGELGTGTIFRVNGEGSQIKTGSGGVQLSNGFAGTTDPAQAVEVAAAASLTTTY
jgi:hypothetical protein